MVIVSQNPSSSMLIHTAREVDDNKPFYVLQQVMKFVDDFIAEKGRVPRICCLGLAFKPDIDDFRESPALLITKKLQDSYPGSVAAIEPNFLGSNLNGIPLITSAELQVYDVVVILVKHREFYELHLRNDVKIFDYVGLYVGIKQ